MYFLKNIISASFHLTEKLLFHRKKKDSSCNSLIKLNKNYFVTTILIYHSTCHPEGCQTLKLDITGK